MKKTDRQAPRTATKLGRRTLGAGSALALAFAACASGDSVGGAPGGDAAPGPTKGRGVFPTVYGPRTLGYEIVDGRKIHQGDMILGDEVSADETGPDGAVRGQAGVIAAPSRRWPQGVVYYSVDPTMTDVLRINKAIAMWETKTNIRFVHSWTAPDRVRFKPISEVICRSDVGRIGGEQTIELHGTCDEANVAHEIGHALGLYHEMERLSRNNDVVIGSCKLNDPNFTIYSPSEGQDFGPYDFYSLMHYDGCATCSNGEFHVARASDGTCVKETDSLSVGDRNAIGWLYGYQNGVTSQDYDNDGRADLVYFKRSNGDWNVRPSKGGPDVVVNWGFSTDQLVPGDYDNDGKTDFAIFRPSEGNWYIRYAKGGPDTVTQWGFWYDIPVQGDYDGDGRTDPAVFRTAEGNWYVRPSNGGPDIIVQWGVQTDVAVPGDYDNDGKTDFAIFRPSEGNWYIRYAKGGPDAIIPWGEAGDLPLPADYDNDGKTDPAVFRARTRRWLVRLSGGGDINLVFGEQGDRFVPADYDGDKRADLAVFQPATGQWKIRRSTTGVVDFVTYGSWANSTPGSR